LDEIIFPHLSVIIPFYNEEGSVALLLDDLVETLSTLQRSWEIIAINDGSSDTTGEELDRCVRRWPQLRVIRHERNRGQAAALWSGFTAARGQVFVTLDGDLQNDPKDIPRLLKRLEGDVDLVGGVRHFRRDSTLRRHMSRLANLVRRRLLRDEVSDTGCALKVFRREVWTSFLPICTLYSFMPAFAVAAGFRVAEMPVNHLPRISGRSKYGLGVMLWRPLFDLIGVWWFTRRRIPREP